MGRMELIHGLANGVGVILANLQVLRELQTDPEALEIMADMAIAAQRVHRNFEALRRLG